MSTSEQQLPATHSMILRTTQTSPFGRKIRIAAKVLKLEPLIAIEAADTMADGDSLRSQNPLGKMPTLVLQDGTSLFDSRVILEYFNDISPAGAIIPSDGMPRYQALTLSVLADGIADAALLIAYEARFRDPEHWSDRWLEHQRGKIARALDVFQAQLPSPEVADIVSISLSCALSYLDWRKPFEWRDLHPPVSDWLDRFAASEPAFRATSRPQ